MCIHSLAIERARGRTKRSTIRNSKLELKIKKLKYFERAASLMLAIYRKRQHADSVAQWAHKLCTIGYGQALMGSNRHVQFDSAIESLDGFNGPEQKKDARVLSIVPAKLVSFFWDALFLNSLIQNTRPAVDRPEQSAQSSSRSGNREQTLSKDLSAKTCESQSEIQLPQANSIGNVQPFDLNGWLRR